MKLAAISDIHGNLGALDAVLADIARRGVDVIVNLGDIVSGPLEPAATADRLMPLRLPTIRGNHERQLAELGPADLNLSDSYAFKTVSPDQLAWLKSLPPALWLTDDIFLCHGTPDDDLCYFLDTVEPSGARPASVAEAAVRAGTIAASLILCGHSHTPRIVRLDDGRLIVNPGSVGLQAYEWDWPFAHTMATGSPHARYAVIENTGDGWHAEIIPVAYDWERAATEAGARGRPDWVVPLWTGHNEMLL